MNGLVNLQRIGWEASTSTNSVSRACPFRHRDFELRCHHAQVAKLAHADALGASAARLAGSNPVLSTIGDRSPPLRYQPVSERRGESSSGRRKCRPTCPCGAMVAQLICNQQVVSSNLTSGSTICTDGHSPNTTVSYLSDARCSII